MLLPSSSSSLDIAALSVTIGALFAADRRIRRESKTISSKKFLSQTKNKVSRASLASG